MEARGPRRHLRGVAVTAARMFAACCMAAPPLLVAGYCRLTCPIYRERRAERLALLDSQYPETERAGEDSGEGPQS